MFIKRNLIFVFIILMMIGFKVSHSRADEDGKRKWGFSFLAGTNVRDDPDFAHFALLPRAGWALHKNWDFELEGNFSYYFRIFSKLVGTEFRSFNQKCAILYVDLI
jgi:hypothetical protein